MNPSSILQANERKPPKHLPFDRRGSFLLSFRTLPMIIFDRWQCAFALHSHRSGRQRRWRRRRRLDIVRLKVKKVVRSIAHVPPICFISWGIWLGPGVPGLWGTPWGPPTQRWRATFYTLISFSRLGWSNSHTDELPLLPLLFMSWNIQGDLKEVPNKIPKLS